MFLSVYVLLGVVVSCPSVSVKKRSDASTRVALADDPPSMVAAAESSVITSLAVALATRRSPLPWPWIVAGMAVPFANVLAAVPPLKTIEETCEALNRCRVAPPDEVTVMLIVPAACADSLIVFGVLSALRRADVDFQVDGSRVT